MPRRPSGIQHTRRFHGTGRARLAYLLAGLLGLLPSPPSADAQVLPSPLGGLLVPAGRIRLDFSPSYTTWSARYGPHVENGVSVDGEEPLGADLSYPERVFPGIGALRQSIRDLSGQSDYQVHVGSTSGKVDREVSRIDTGLRLGVFDWLTLGVTVPYVKTRATVDVGFVADPAANVGANPNATSPSAVSALLSGLASARSAAEDRAASLCGGGDDACSDAQALADRVGSFSTLANRAYLSSPVFPTASAPVAEALSSALSSLDADLVAAGLGGIGTQMAFASATLDAAGFASLSDDPSVNGAPLAPTESLWMLGDVEVSAAVRILDGEVRDSGAASPRLAWTLAGGALVRLATGTVDDPSIAFDVGSGDGQMDVEGRVDGALRIGRHVDVRASARYGTQAVETLLRRVALHERVFPPAGLTRAVRWTPGSYVLVELSPRWHLGEALALSIDLRRYHKGADRYELVAGQAEGLLPVSAVDLEHETEMTLQEFAVGFRYSTVGLWRDGKTGTPFELGGRLIRAVGGSGGQAPKNTRVEFSASVFRRLWGSP